MVAIDDDELSDVISWVFGIYVHVDNVSNIPLIHMYFVLQQNGFCSAGWKVELFDFFCPLLVGPLDFDDTEGAWFKKKAVCVYV